jgi:putative heme transporter
MDSAELDASDRAPRWDGRARYRSLASVAVAVAIFAFALPRLADYGEAWASLTAMTGSELGAVLAAGLWNLMTYWPVLMISLPGLRLHEAAVVNQASTAVANTVPAGGAVALGVTYRMLHAWGFTSPSIANHVLATGVWNTMVKFGLPVVAVAAMVLTGALRDSTLELAVIGLLALAGCALVAARVLADERSARRFGGWVDPVVVRVQRRRGRPGPADASQWLLRTRRELIALLRRRGAAMTVATVVSHLSLYVVLLTALRSVGIPEEQLGWEKVLAGFALVRLLSALPVTPGGFGVVELGYVAYLTAGSDELAAGVTAAVLLFRAITFLFPVVLGALAWVIFTTRPSWRRPRDTRGELPGRALAGSVS